MNSGLDKEIKHGGMLSQLVNRITELQNELRTISGRPAIPQMTTVERNSIAVPLAGYIIYNTTTNKLNFYNGVGWEVVTSV